MSTVDVAGLPVYGTLERVSRRLASMVVGSQAPVIFFGAVGARALAQAGTGAGYDPDGANTVLVAGVVLTVLAILAAGMLRRPYGVTLGWFVQIACLLAAFVVPMMGIVGLIFGGLWVVALYQGRKMDDLTAAYLREHPEAAAPTQPQR